MFGIAETVSVVVLFAWSLSTVFERKLSVLAGRSRASIFITAFGLVPITLIFALNQGGLNAYAILLSIASGVFFTIGTLLYYTTLETEQVSNTAPTGLLQTLPLIAFGVLALGESVSALEIGGAALMVAGVLAASTTKGFSLNRKLLPAALANVSWAVYWILASLAITSSGQFASPIIVSRVVSVALAVLAFGLFYKKRVGSLKVTKRAVSVIIMVSVAAGMLDGVGNSLFAFVVHINALHVASIFITPMLLLITLWGYLFYSERITRLQKIGIIVAFCGALVIALL